MRADDFNSFYAARKNGLLGMTEGAMGKAALQDGIGNAEDCEMPDAEDLDTAQGWDAIHDGMAHKAYHLEIKG